ncbi:WASH complex subunit 4 [Aricia agestis]|uniref:WASH complex subunit 4 n=1 Tax=Aricia agestis TaxID=91739 RepID=UPI001C20B390|nr:WASH complex subunit 4 [Aricia agestis]
MKSDSEKEAGALVLKSYGEFFKKQIQDYTILLDPERLRGNKTFAPVQVNLTHKEQILINELVTSDNLLITKVLSVLASLCSEIKELKVEAFERHFKFLAVYDEYTDSEITNQIESICFLSAFVGRCNDTLNNLCSQLFSIFTQAIVNINGIQWHYILNNIGEIFTILVLCELLISKCSLVTKWNKFYKHVHNNCKPYELDSSEEKHKAMLVAMENITKKIMNDDIVQNSLSSLLVTRQKYLGNSSTNVHSEFTNYIKNVIVNLDKLIQEKCNSENMYKCIKINSLFVLNSYLFSSSDKKNFKNLIELNTKAHSVFVIGTVFWFPEQFLQRYVPFLCAQHNKLSQTMLKARQAYLTAKKNSISRDIVNLQNISMQWIMTVEDVFSSSNKLNAAEMTLHTKVILDGLDIVSCTNYSILTFVNLHLLLGLPLSKNLLFSLFDIMEVLKSLKNAVSRNYNQIINSMDMIGQHLTYQAVSSILHVKKTLMNDKKYASKRLDELTCLVVAEQAIKGASTVERNIAAHIALSFVPESTYIEDSYVRLGSILDKTQAVISFIKSMNNFSNCSWVLWHQNILPIYFQTNFSMQLQAVKLAFFLMVLDDGINFLHETEYMFGVQKSNEFKNTVIRIINDHVIQKFNDSIESNLRLHIHSHLQLDVVDPLADNMVKKIFLLMDNLRLYNVYMSVVPSIEHYLSKTYYNLTTIVLSDWKTYGEMRQMAKLKFNVSTIQDNLPTQTLEQGLDVLEIMRNIHIFVAKYQYNLNNQIFIEKSSNNKHLNSINIRHIANSIRTHGTGIMNTTVNFTYQFLKNKFIVFSQFLYDEQIKSRLVKDLRHFKEIKLQTNMYPYKSADKFNKAIKVLGVSDDGQSYLDLFRDLISQIGNAMGYVRMIRSGGRHCCSNATVFLPNLDPKRFKDMCEENKLSPQTIRAAENFDENVNGIISNFIQGTEYFKLLVDVFAPVFRNPKNVHLKNFFIIIPPLTVNFVEHMILSKDKLSKKNKTGATFTDDGFAMGVAYILKLLDQDSSFESLYWFDSIWNHIRKEKELINEQKTKGTLQLQQTLALTEKKIKTLEEEYKLLYYSLTSARIFFR